MKSLILPLVVLAVMIGGFIINDGFLDSLCEQMEQMTAALPDEREEPEAALEQIGRIRSMWEENRAAADLSVDFKDISKLSAALADMYYFLENSEWGLYYSAKAQFLFYLEVIGNFEGVTGDNLY